VTPLPLMRAAPRGTMGAMSIARSLLLRASRSPWLADQFRQRAFARRAVRRFMPGEALGDALDAAQGLAGAGIGSVVTALGERVTNRAEAEAVRDHYVQVLDTIAARALPAQPSVKLTHLGLDIDRDLCAASVRALADHAAARGSMLWVDIEESHYVDATLDVYRRVREAQPKVGLCLQAYLRRTPTDLASLLAMGAAIRLVKGAYREPPSVAYDDKRDVDMAYLALAERMLESAAAFEGGLPVFGTHDLALVERIRDKATALGLPRGAWEVHMLYGIRTAEQRALATSGVAMRVLISYGTHWFPWYVRRLAERPANVWFVVRSLVS
jgi:proline dehydrogenase